MIERVRGHIGILLAAGVFLIDLLVVPRHILAYRDSLDLVTSSYLLQAAHPPGYPLYVVLSKLLTVPLAWIPSVYTRYAIVNSLYGCLTVLLVYHCGLLLTARPQPSATDGPAVESEGDPMLSGLAALGLAWSYSFWLYRLIPEVFMMAMLASMFSLWLLLAWRRALVAGHDSARRWWMAFGVSLGLGLVCHPITILWWPAFVVIALAWAGEDWWRLVLPAVIGIVVGFFSSVLVWIMAFFPHTPMWGNQPDLKSFIGFIMRSDYGGPASAGPVADASQQFRQWPMNVYFSNLWFNFGPLVYLAPGALWLCLRWGERYLSFLPLTWLLAGPVFLTYGGYRTDSAFYLGSVETFYLPSYLAFVLMMLVLLDRLVGSHARVRLVVAAALAVMIGFALVRNYPLVDRHDHTASESFSHDLLDNVPQNAILVVHDDQDIFVADYELWVARSRPDVVLLNYGFIHKPGYQAEFAAIYPDVKLNPSYVPSIFMRHFIADNINGERRICTATVSSAAAWGCDGNPYFLRPRGKVFEVVKSNREIPGDAAVLPFAPELNRSIPDIDYWNQALFTAYRLSWQNLADVYIQLGMPSRARTLYAQMIGLDPHESTWRGSLQRIEGRADTFKPRDSTDYRAADAATFNREGLEALKVGDYERAAAALDMACELAPGNAQYANQAGVVRMSWHDYRGALPLLQRAVQLEPNNTKYVNDLDAARQHL